MFLVSEMGGFFFAQKKPTASVLELRRQETAVLGKPNSARYFGVEAEQIDMYRAQSVVTRAFLAFFATGEAARVRDEAGWEMRRVRYGSDMKTTSKSRQVPASGALHQI